MGLLVANAFAKDIWVKTDSVLVEEFSSVNKQKFCANAGAKLGDVLPSLQAEAGAGYEGERAEKTVVNRFMEIGFTKMSKGNLTTFKPAQNSSSEDMKVVYLTIACVNNQGGVEYFANNHPHNENHCLIVSESGGIVDSKGKKYPWVDLNGKYHYCRDCLSDGKECTVCFMEKNLQKIQSSLETVQSTDIGHSLMMTVDTIKKQGKMMKKKTSFMRTMDLVSKEEIMAEGTIAKEIITDIGTLATDYRKLETRTKQCVRDIKDYGLNLKEAAADYIEDGNITEFLVEIGDVSCLKDSLNSANEQHEEIKGQLKSLDERTHVQEIDFNQKSEEGNKKAKAILIPGELSGMRLKENAQRVEKVIQQMDINETTKNIAIKCTEAQTIVTCVVMTVTETITYPILFPINYFMSKMVQLDSQNFTIMENQFKAIQKQMQSINVHLTDIIGNIQNIGSNLNRTRSAQVALVNKIEGQTSSGKAEREERVSKLIKRANALITSCDAYHTTLEEATNMNALGRNMDAIL